MNILLIFFAIPVATIILSAILETFIHCPIKVAGIFFSIFLVVTFALDGSAELLVATIIYTIISFTAALIVNIITRNRYCDSIVDTSGYNYNIDNTIADETSTTNDIAAGNIATNTNPLNGCFRRYR